MPLPRLPLNLIALLAALNVTGCMPHGPYQFRDYTNTLRVGGDFIEMVTYKPGRLDPDLHAPFTIYPLNFMVFSHYPRELVFRWEPDYRTPRNAEYFFEEDFTCDTKDKKFGDWSKAPDPMFAYRTAKTSLNDRFVGAQPGRWRVKVKTSTGESDWSEWQYFLFTR